MKDLNNRLFVFMHGDGEEQQQFIKQCHENECFAQEIQFMVGQKPITFYRRSIDNESLEKTININGERPYLTVSNANPDQVGKYFNWTYLESIIESGWERQFGVSKS